MISRRIFAAVALLCALSLHAQAQQTKAALNAEINVQFPDNTSNAITPQNLRTVTSGIVNSTMPTAPVVSGNLVCFDGTTGLPKDCGIPPTQIVPRATVKVQRTNTTGSATWGAYDAFNNFLTDCNTSQLACAQAAVNAAFPYASVTPLLGYDLEFIGGDDPARGQGINFGGGATVLNFGSTGALQFPAIQGGKIRSGAITFNGGSATDTLIFDSCEMCDVDFSGAQLVPLNTGGISLRFKPTVGTPVDGNLGTAPARLHFTTVNGRARVDLSGNSLAFLEYTNLHINEVNGQGVTSGCVVLLDSPATGQNLGHNHVTIDQLHNIGSGAIGLCEGTTGPASGAVLGKSTYNIGIAPDATNTANGVDTWGSGNEWHIQATGFNTGYTLKFESGACKNVAVISSDQASPTITDSSGCTGTSANIWIVNGTLFVGGVTVAGTLTGADGGAWTSGGINNSTIGATTPKAITGTNVSGQAGNSASNVRMSGRLTSQLTPTGNGADTTEDTLQTFSFPANGFDAVGRCVKIEAWGTFAANADSKTVRLYFGAVFYNSTGLTLSNGAWYVWGRVCKTGSNTQTSIATGTFLNSIPVTNAGSLSQTDTSAITIKVTGQAGTANANDIVANGMTVTMEN